MFKVLNETLESDFRSSHSAEFPLLNATNWLSRIADYDQEFIFILLDLSADLNTIDYSISNEKL